MTKSLARFTKKRTEKTQINKIRNEKGEITMGTAEIQKRVREYYEQLCAGKFDNLEEMNNFLEIYSLPKLNQEERDQLNRLIIRKESEYVIKTSLQKKSNTRWLHRQSLPNIQILPNLFPSSINFFKGLMKKEHSQRHSMMPPSP